jgi:hypothetical protein
MAVHTERSHMSQSFVSLQSVDKEWIMAGEIH